MSDNKYRIDDDVKIFSLKCNHLFGFVFFLPMCCTCIICRPIYCRTLNFREHLIFTNFASGLNTVRENKVPQKFTATVFTATVLSNGNAQNR